jgi:large subunit ribosomal protein LP2
LNGAPTKDRVKAVLKAGGVDVDNARLDEVFAQFQGKDFNAVVAAGRGKIGNAGAGAAPAGGSAPAASAAAAPAAKKVEEKKVEEEEDGDMGFGLFD